VVTALLGYPSDEAASILHMSAATVRMHASRGRAAMQGLIGEPYDR
jgi:DNA-directed RNA polymerase specialized sigma24 family protein